MQRVNAAGWGSVSAAFFCHCVIEALAGFFFLLNSLKKKQSVIVKCCKDSGRRKGGRGSVARGGEILYEGGGQVDRNKKECVPLISVGLDQQ